MKRESNIIFYLVLRQKGNLQYFKDKIVILDRPPFV